MEEDISEIDNTNAKRVFNHFGITDLEDYHKFYLLTDVLLLADVLENFSDVSLQYYGVDLAHNYTSPGLSQQAALKMMDVELDLFTDIDKHLFIEDVIRGEWKWSATNTPAMLLLNPFSPGILWKIGIKKSKKRNFKRLYLKY